MRTTVDIPDDLYRQAKSEAALQGRRLRDIVEEGLRSILGLPVGAPMATRVAFPLHRSRHPGTLSAADVTQGHDDALLEEDANFGKLV